MQWLRPRRVIAEAELAAEEVETGHFQRSLSLITAFSAIVSGFEAYIQHQRGAFDNWLMWTPVWLTPPTVLVAAGALISKRVARWALPVVAAISFVDGVVGFGYHLRGIARLPGGWKLGQYNIVMGPPVFAPLLTCLVGVLGGIAAFLRREQPNLREATALRATSVARHLTREVTRPNVLRAVTARIARGRFQRAMALTSAVFAVLAGGEAYFEHLRGSYNQRIMWTPVWVTPPMVLAGIGAAISARVARWVLPFAAAATLVDGLLGFLLHLQGIKRMPGGFTNLRFNITLGPPLFAPLLLSAVGLIGFIATLLRREED